MANLPRQIIGSFEDLGKQIGSEVVKAPAEIAGKALESLGATSKGLKGQTTTSPMKPSELSNGKPTPLDEFTTAKDAKTKEATAHRALEYLASRGKKTEPTVRERLDREAAEKNKKEEKKLAAAAAFQPLVSPKGKRRRGDLYGISGKASWEKSRNVRPD